MRVCQGIAIIPPSSPHNLIFVQKHLSQLCLVTQTCKQCVFSYVAIKILEEGFPHSTALLFICHKHTQVQGPDKL